MWRASLGALLVLLPLTGCSAITLGEFGEAACNDRKDNDRDGLTDCDDPDCLGTETCRRGDEGPQVSRPDASIDAGTIKPIDAGAMDAGPRDAGSAKDAGTLAPAPDATLDEDGGSVDGQVASCMPACAATETCVEGHCQSATASGTYVLQINSAMAPTFDAENLCYDSECLVPPDPMPGPYCACLPDPYVRVVLVHNGAEISVGNTATVSNTVLGSYSAMWTIMLAPGDVLRFEVWDDDKDVSPPVFDTELYACQPSLKSIPGRLSCTYMGTGANPFRYQVTARLSLSTP